MGGNLFCCVLIIQPSVVCRVLHTLFVNVESLSDSREVHCKMQTMESFFDFVAVPLFCSYLWTLQKYLFNDMQLDCYWNNFILVHTRIDTSSGNQTNLLSLRECHSLKWRIWYQMSNHSLASSVYSDEFHITFDLLTNYLLTCIVIVIIWVSPFRWFHFGYSIFSLGVLKKNSKTTDYFWLWFGEYVYEALKRQISSILFLCVLLCNSIAELVVGVNLQQ